MMTNATLPIDTRRAQFRASLDRAAAALRARAARAPFVVRHRGDDPRGPHLNLARVAGAYRRGVFLYLVFADGAAAIANDYVEHRRR